MPALRIPPRGTKGFCAYTKAGEGVDCLESQVKGTWDAPDLQSCVAKCRKCKQCNFVSFDQTDFDCSWFLRCPKVHGVHGDSDYKGQHVTYHVTSPHGIQVGLPPEEVTWRGLVVGRLHGSIDAYKGGANNAAEAERLLSSLSDSCDWGAKLTLRRRFRSNSSGYVDESCSASRPVLVVGTLSMADDRALKLRQWHRGVHCTQGCSSVLMRYILTADDVERGKQEAAQKLAEMSKLPKDKQALVSPRRNASLATENETYHDLYILPSVPRGFDQLSARPPRGAQCVLKVRISCCFVQ